MKKLFAMILSLMIVAAASAQVKGPGKHYHPRIPVRLDADYFLPDYSLFSFPCYPPYRSQMGPSALQLDIEHIRTEYENKIHSVRRDKSMSRSERKATICQLKSDRELAISNTQRNYQRAYENLTGTSH